MVKKTTSNFGKKDFKCYSPTSETLEKQKDWKLNFQFFLLCGGVVQDHAYVWRRTRMGCWAVGQSPILVTTITLKRLEMRGYMPMLDYYTMIAPHLNEALYKRPLHAVVREVLPVPESSGAGPSTRLGGSVIIQFSFH